MIVRKMSKLSVTQSKNQNSKTTVITAKPCKDILVITIQTCDRKRCEFFGTDSKGAVERVDEEKSGAEDSADPQEGAAEKTKAEADGGKDIDVICPPKYPKESSPTAQDDNTGGSQKITEDLVVSPEDERPKPPTTAYAEQGQYGGNACTRCPEGTCPPSVGKLQETGRNGGNVCTACPSGTCPPFLGKPPETEGSLFEEKPPWEDENYSRIEDSRIEDSGFTGPCNKRKGTCIQAPCQEIQCINDSGGETGSSRLTGDLFSRNDTSNRGKEDDSPVKQANLSFKEENSIFGVCPGPSRVDGKKPPSVGVGGEQRMSSTWSQRVFSLPILPERYHGPGCAMEISILEKHSPDCQYKKSDNSGRNPADDTSAEYECIGRLILRCCNRFGTYRPCNCTSGAPMTSPDKDPFESGSVRSRGNDSTRNTTVTSPRQQDQESIYNRTKTGVTKAKSCICAVKVKSMPQQSDRARKQQEADPSESLCKRGVKIVGDKVTNFCYSTPRPNKSTTQSNVNKTNQQQGLAGNDRTGESIVSGRGESIFEDDPEIFEENLAESTRIGNSTTASGKVKKPCDCTPEKIKSMIRSNIDRENPAEVSPDAMVKEEVNTTKRWKAKKSCDCPPNKNKSMMQSSANKERVADNLTQSLVKENAATTKAGKVKKSCKCTPEKIKSMMQSNVDRENPAAENLAESLVEENASQKSGKVKQQCYCTPRNIKSMTKSNVNKDSPGSTSYARRGQSPAGPEMVEDNFEEPTRRKSGRTRKSCECPPNANKSMTQSNVNKENQSLAGYDGTGAQKPGTFDESLTKKPCYCTPQTIKSMTRSNVSDREKPQENLERSSFKAGDGTKTTKVKKSCNCIPETARSRTQSNAARQNQQEEEDWRKSTPDKVKKPCYCTPQTMAQSNVSRQCQPSNCPKLIGEDRFFTPIPSRRGQPVKNRTIFDEIPEDEAIFGDDDASFRTADPQQAEDQEDEEEEEAAAEEGGETEEEEEDDAFKTSPDADPESNDFGSDTDSGPLSSNEYITLEPQIFENKDRHVLTLIAPPAATYNLISKAKVKPPTTNNFAAGKYSGAGRKHFPGDGCVKQHPVPPILLDKSTFLGLQDAIRLHNELKSLVNSSREFPQFKDTGNQTGYLGGGADQTVTNREIEELVEELKAMQEIKQDMLEQKMREKEERLAELQSQKTVSTEDGESMLKRAFSEHRKTLPPPPPSTTPASYRPSADVSYNRQYESVLIVPEPPTERSLRSEVPSPSNVVNVRSKQGSMSLSNSHNNNALDHNTNFRQSSELSWFTPNSQGGGSHSGRDSQQEAKRPRSLHKRTSSNVAAGGNGGVKTGFLGLFSKKKNKY